MNPKVKAFTSILFLLFFAVAQVSASAIEKVIFISVDTLRADYLGCYNHKMKTSPNLDQFASENVLYLNNTAQAATTAPSHKSIFYSAYPSIHKTTLRQLPEEKIKSPIEVIRANGFKTAAFTGGGQVSKDYGFDRGFDVFQEASGPDAKHGIDRTRQLAFEWLQKNRDEKFFLFLHTFEPHCPYNPPAAFFRKWSAWYEGRVEKDRCHPDFYMPQRRLTEIDYSYIKSLYSGEVNYVDSFLRDLFEKLKTEGIYERTLIIFFSDHGESLGERGYLGHSQLYDVQLHVPLILHIPGISARQITSPTESVDIMPTVFELLGITNSYRFQGKSLMPVLNHAGTFDKGRPRVSEEVGKVRVRIGDFAMIFSPNREDEEELYNLKNDPEENEDIADENPNILRELKLPYFKMINTSKELSSRFIRKRNNKSPISPETIEKLKALGYTGN